MPDDKDSYLDISFDDDDESSADSGVLDLTLDDEPASSPAQSPPQARRPAKREQPLSVDTPTNAAVTDVPMLATGVCAQCGYALRPLEETCPRCRRSVHDPVENSVEKPSNAVATGPESQSPAPQPLLPSPHRTSPLFAVAGVIVFLALVIGLPLYLWMQPAARARREYRVGLAAQLAGDFEAARQHYQLALTLDPRMGLAAFSIGTTYLKIGDPALMQSIQEITERAVWGHTGELDEADKWFQQAVTIGQALAPNTRLMDQRISDPPRLRAFAHACMALTALIRASAAMQADQLEDSMNWFGVAAQMAQAAVVDDPENASANQILRQIPPTIPATNTVSP